MQVSNRNFRPKALLVDLDNTLYDYARAAARATEALVAILSTRFGLDGREVLERYQAVRESTGDDAVPSGRELRRMRMRRLLDSWPVSAGHKEGPFVEAYEKALLSSVVWYPGAQSALELFASLMPVLIITEVREDVGRQILDALKLRPEKWRALFTYSHRVSKRDGSAFALALEWIRQPPEAVVMIGDNWTLDIIGASLAGIRQLWKSDGRPVPASVPEGFLGAVGHFSEAQGFLSVRSRRVPDGPN